MIGLTGMYCAGKNYIASLLEKKGLPVLDVDKLGHPVLESEKEKIFARFGDDLKKDDGSLDRRLLGKRVFGDPEKLTALEGIVHPPVNRITDEWIAAQKSPCVINAALLHKSSAFERLDRIILVTAPWLVRFSRARKRDNLSIREVIKRFASQKGFNTQYLHFNNLTVKTSRINAEIYRMENPGFAGVFTAFFSNPKYEKKLEIQVDKFIEGMK